MTQGDAESSDSDSVNERTNSPPTGGDPSVSLRIMGMLIAALVVTTGGCLVSSWFVYQETARNFYDDCPGNFTEHIESPDLRVELETRFAQIQAFPMSEDSRKELGGFFIMYAHGTFGEDQDFDNVEVAQLTALLDEIIDADGDLARVNFEKYRP